MMDKPIVEIPLSQSAQDEILKAVIKDTEVLILESKIIASSENASEVGDRDVREAKLNLAKQADNSKGRDAVLILGSTFLGAFLPGFIEATQNANIGSIVVWVVVGIV
jgi:hypothetical protein